MVRDFVSRPRAFLPAIEDPRKLIIETRYRYENISKTGICNKDCESFVLRLLVNF